jgi:outer membrane protein assembly factor BamA
VGVGYELRYYEPQFVVRYEPDAPRPIIPRRGTTSVASTSFFFSSARGFADSVSAEEGHVLALAARHSSRYTGGTFAFTAGDARYQTYLKVPWLEHHALALQLAGGAAVGDIGDRAVYALGGAALADPILQLLRAVGAPSPSLRGYPPGALSGNAFALGSLEYRFPIAVLDQGIDTLPVYLRRVHGAAFADAAAVADEPFHFGRPRAAAGVEVRVEVTLGYSLGAVMRVGVARGFNEGGVTQPYVTLGSPF